MPFKVKPVTIQNWSTIASVPLLLRLDEDGGRYFIVLGYYIVLLYPSITIGTRKRRAFEYMIKLVNQYLARVEIWFVM
jgi:hypothetical protein